MSIRRSCSAGVLCVAAWLAGCDELLGNQDHGVLLQEGSDANTSGVQLTDAPAAGEGHAPDASGSDDGHAPDASVSEDGHAPDASVSGDGQAADASTVSNPATDSSIVEDRSTDSATGGDVTLSRPPGADASIGADASAADAGPDVVAPVLETLTVNFRGLGSQGASIASSPAGISCSGATCTSTASFAQGTSVVLTVTQAAGAILAWSNSCMGKTCSLTLGAPQTIGVTTTNQNLVFVANVASVSPAFGGVAGADALCASAATGGTLPGHYVAFLWTSTMTFYSRLGSARGWIRTDGLPFTDTVAGFQNGIMWYPFGVDASGAFFRANIWTGSVAGEDCTDWTSTATTSAVGIANAEGSPLLDFSQDFCAPDPLVNLACFGTDLTQAVTLSPATGRHAFSSSAMLLSGGIAAADTLCQMEASAAGLPNATHFLAALSTSKATAASRFDLTGAPWVRVDGVQLATTPADLMAGTLIAPPYTDANGMPVNGQLWVGSAGGLTALSGSTNESCADWTSTSAAVMGIHTEPGLVLFNDFAVEADDPSLCNVPSSVLCLEN